MEQLKKLLVNKNFLIIFVLILILIFLLLISFGNKKSSSFSMPSNTTNVIEKGNLSNVTYSKYINVIGEFNLIDGNIHYKLNYTIKKDISIDWINGSGVLNLPVSYKTSDGEKNQILKIGFDKFEKDENGDYFVSGVYHEDNKEFTKVNIKNNMLNFRIKHKSLEIKLKNNE